MKGNKVRPIKVLSPGMYELKNFGGGEEGFWAL